MPRPTTSAFVLFLLALPGRAQDLWVSEGSPPIGSPTLLSLENPYGPAGGVGLIWAGPVVDPPVAVAGVEGLVRVAPLLVVKTGLLPLTSNQTIPNDPTLVGLRLPLQGVVSTTAGIQLSNAIVVWIGAPAAIDPLQSYGSFGSSIAAAPGGTIAIGSSTAFAGGVQSGVVEVYGPGSNAPFHLWTLAPPTPQGGEGFGYRVAVGGGLTLVGANAWNGSSPTLSDMGRAVLFNGQIGTQLLPPAAAQAGVLWFGASVALGDLDGAGGVEAIVGATGPGAGPSGPTGNKVFVFHAPGAANQTVVTLTDPLGPNGFGQVLAAGNFTGGAGADLAVGAPDCGLFYTGVGWIASPYVGRVVLFDGESYVTAFGPPTTASYQFFGSAIAIGDLTGDGIGDVLVGARGTRRAFLYKGAASGAPEYQEDVHLWPIPDELGFGVSVAIADVDGDGKNDAVIGAADGSGQDSVWVFYGPVQNAADTQMIAHLHSPATSDLFGQTLAAVDVTGNGKADLVVGAPLTGWGSGMGYFFAN